MEKTHPRATAQMTLKQAGAWASRRRLQAQGVAYAGGVGTPKHTLVTSEHGAPLFKRKT